MPAVGKGRFQATERVRPTSYSNMQSTGVSKYMPKMPVNTYRDSSGAVHCVSTETGEAARQSMEHLRYQIEDGGDMSNCHYKVIGAPTSWPAEHKV